jgi:hypothetical protein
VHGSWPSARAPLPRRTLIVRHAVEAPGVEVPPLSDDVKAKIAEQGLDFERSGLKYLSNDARVGACCRVVCLGNGMHQLEQLEAG